MLERIDGESRLKRDSYSGAIINVSSTAYQSAKLRRKKFREMDDLKKEVLILKDIVLKLVEKLDK